MDCQLKFMDEIGEKNTWFNDKLQCSIRKLRYFRKKTIRSLRPVKPGSKYMLSVHDEIKPGDIIRVCSKNEINRTLDRYHETGGCKFQTGMYADCGKELMVLKKVDHFFDESKQKFCKCKDLFLLESSCCSGTTAYLKPCGRNCFFFWHKNWLKKV